MTTPTIQHTVPGTQTDFIAKKVKKAIIQYNTVIKAPLYKKYTNIEKEFFFSASESASTITCYLLGSAARGAFVA